MYKICEKCHKRFQKPYSRSKKEWSTSRYCSHGCANSVNADPTRLVKWCKNHGAPMKGKKRPDLVSHLFEKKCLCCGNKFLVRPYRKDVAKYCSRKCNWKSRDEGKSSLAMRIRKSKEYAIWRTAVFMRDNYTCQICGAHSGNEKAITLHADHIKPFSLYPELRFAIDNGRTLCIECHKQTDTYGFSVWRKNCMASNQET